MAKGGSHTAGTMSSGKAKIGTSAGSKTAGTMATVSKPKGGGGSAKYAGTASNGAGWKMAKGC